MPTEMSIRELYQLAKDGTTLELDQLDFVQLQGWVLERMYLLLP
mgnify:CR=1 FL=1